MHRIKELPPYLADRYRSWSTSTFAENRDWFRRLADEGQKPQAMVIACCDSRVTVESIFGRGPGEIFVHRNIANLVPTHTPDGGHHGTAAAVEFAVEVLKVAHLLVLGHSGCGGVRGCMEMCEGKAPHLDRRDSYVGRWLDELRPAHDAVREVEDPDLRAEAMEKEGVRVSLEHLMGFPFVKSAVESGQLRLHGLWVGIGDGKMESYDGELRRFSPV
ncbi:carbonic anhydrase [Rhodobacterales bacterium HKCCE3408]|nr:carbonic anhydrase [Rhodobacterales bacterium HKCCE3408]